MLNQAVGLPPLWNALLEEPFLFFARQSQTDFVEMLPEPVLYHIPPILS